MDTKRPRKLFSIHMSEALARRLDAIVARYPFATRHAVQRLATIIGLERLEAEPELVTRVGQERKEAR